jgi:hypothetical protein
MADEDCLFSIGLGNQQSVKWVPVMRWQVMQGQDMPESDQQHLAIVGLLLGNHFRQGETQMEFAQLELDLHFPEACHTEEEQVRAILTRCARLWRELGVGSLSHQMKA